MYSKLKFKFNLFILILKYKISNCVYNRQMVKRKISNQNNRISFKKTKNLQKFSFQRIRKLKIYSSLFRSSEKAKKQVIFD